MFEKMNTAFVRTACETLAKRDEALKKVFEKYGPPPLWARAEGFETVVHMILEQQVSLASANAAYQKMKKAASGESLAPEQFLAFSEQQLKDFGFSRQKIGYARGLAEAVLSGKMDFDKLPALDDDAAKTELKKLKGIGDWTAEIYLSECLLRPDVLPRGDIAMLEAVRVLKNLSARPAHPEFEKMTESWRPFRSVGTRLLWVFYLKEIRTASTGIGAFLPEEA